MLEPVAPISSWHQVILAVSVLTSSSWNLCSNSANQSDSTCCLWSYFPMWLTMELIVSVCFMTLIVSFFPFFLELLFTFYFSFYNYFYFSLFLFTTTFYFLLFLFKTAFYYISFLLPMSLFLVTTRTSNPPHLPPFVRGALFFLCRGTNIYNSFWGASEFQDTYHGFYILFNFFYFSQNILYIAGARETQKTLYRFLLAKIEGWDKTNRDKNSEHNKQITKINGR